jgi:hypothetical protein
MLNGQTDRPLGVGRVRVGRAVHAERAEREGLRPEDQDRLGPEPVLLGPPEADPVVAADHLARDLAVVGLPRIPEREGAEQRQVEEADDDEDEQARSTHRRREQRGEREGDRVGHRGVATDQRAEEDGEERERAAGEGLLPHGFAIEASERGVSPRARVGIVAEQARELEETAHADDERDEAVERAVRELLGVRHEQEGAEETDHGEDGAADPLGARDRRERGGRGGRCGARFGGGFGRPVGCRVGRRVGSGLGKRRHGRGALGRRFGGRGGSFGSFLVLLAPLLLRPLRLRRVGRRRLTRHRRVV